MAKLITLMLLLTLISISIFTTTAKKYGPGSLKRFECPSECSRRCKKTRYKKPCLIFCNKCCNKCLCVPPGFYGNKIGCPCYDNWKTKRGGPKCP
ncbi:gibberellin-regulated protein 4-like [Andrographis paniculata]|uniref:gibberellin-regulated protein 4-like n=1 Tax=Andrographis paniculata TaxID=175694 RepID=UPI0021E73483|nr:gibberellin-regulated protein 4-like [Andrographis paniculata]